MADGRMSNSSATGGSSRHNGQMDSDHLPDKLERIENTIAHLTSVLEDTCKAVQKLCTAQAESCARQSRHGKLLEDLVEMQHQGSQLLAMSTTRDDQQVRLSALEEELKSTLRDHHDNLEGRLEDSAASQGNVMLRIGGLSSRQDELHEGQAACTHLVRLVSASQQVSTARLNELAATSQRTISTLCQLSQKLDTTPSAKEHCSSRFQARDSEREPSSKRRPSVPTTASVTSSNSAANGRQAEPPALAVMTSDDDVVIQSVRHHSSSALSDRHNASPPLSAGPSQGSASTVHEAQESASRKTSDLFQPTASVLNSNLSTKTIQSLLPTEDQATDKQAPDLVEPPGLLARGDIKDNSRFSPNPDCQPTNRHGSTAQSSLRQTPPPPAGHGQPARRCSSGGSQTTSPTTVARPSDSDGHNEVGELEERQSPGYANADGMDSLSGIFMQDEDDEEDCSSVGDMPSLSSAGPSSATLHSGTAFTTPPTTGNSISSRGNATSASADVPISDVATNLRSALAAATQTSSASTSNSQAPQSCHAEAGTVHTSDDGAADPAGSEYKTDGGQKKKRAVFPASVTAVMKTWINKHFDNPYPTEDEKRAMLLETNLTMQQLDYWFVNARRRLVQPLRERARKEGHTMPFVDVIRNRRCQTYVGLQHYHEPGPVFSLRSGAPPPPHSHQQQALYDYERGHGQGVLTAPDIVRHPHHDSSIGNAIE